MSREVADELEGVYVSAAYSDGQQVTAAVPVGLSAVLRSIADRIDRGPTFRLPPSVLSALIREWADSLVEER